MLKHPGAEHTPTQQYLTPALPLRVHFLLHKPVYSKKIVFCFFQVAAFRVCCMFLADPGPRAGVLAGS